MGKLEIAERERARLKRKAAAVPEVKTEEELRQKEAAAESIAAELIKSEEADKLKVGCLPCCITDCTTHIQPSLHGEYFMVEPSH